MDQELSANVLEVFANVQPDKCFSKRNNSDNDKFLVLTHSCYIESQRAYKIVTMVYYTYSTSIHLAVGDRRG